MVSKLITDESLLLYSEIQILEVGKTCASWNLFLERTNFDYEKKLARPMKRIRLNNFLRFPEYVNQVINYIFLEQFSLFIRSGTRMG